MADQESGATQTGNVYEEARVQQAMAQSTAQNAEDSLRHEPRDDDLERALKESLQDQTEDPGRDDLDLRRALEESTTTSGEAALRRAIQECQGLEVQNRCQECLRKFQTRGECRGIYLHAHQEDDGGRRVLPSRPCKFWELVLLEFIATGSLRSDARLPRRALPTEHGQCGR